MTVKRNGSEHCGRITAVFRRYVLPPFQDKYTRQARNKQEGARLGNITRCHFLKNNIFLRCNLTSIYKTIILPVVLYGCETWSVTLREEHRLRVFENKVLRRIIGPKRDEVTGE
jgi:hypothetical protein